MKIVNEIAYSTTGIEILEVQSIKPLDDMMMIVEFNNNEKRIFDATSLLEMSAFKRLEDASIFKNAKVVDGIITWCNEEIDISSERVYNDSFKYEQIHY